MFNVGGAELLVLLLVALFALGPDKLPAAARRLGQVRAQLQSWSATVHRDLAAALDDSTEP